MACGVYLIGRARFRGVRWEDAGGLPASVWGGP